MSTTPEKKNNKLAMVCNVAMYGIEAALTASAIKRTGKLWPLTVFFIFGEMPHINIIHEPHHA